MKASDNCLNLIRESEGFRSAPYLCPAGIPTIGYGSTHYADGSPVRMTDQPISETLATEIMRTTLAGYEDAVSRYVQVTVNQNQFDALVDFAYNAGTQNLKTSTLLKLLNQGKYDAASREFAKWVYGGGKKLGGLVARRTLESNLFMRPV